METSKACCAFTNYSGQKMASMMISVRTPSSRYQRLFHTTCIVIATSFITLFMLIFVLEIQRGNLELQENFEAKFFERRQRVRNVCSKYFGDVKPVGMGLAEASPLVLARRELFVFSEVYADHDHSILFCLNRKVASENWLATLILNSEKSIYRSLHDLAPEFDNDTFKLPPNIQKVYPFADGNSYEDYAKVMFVRHPLDRLVSAWRDRLTQDTFQTRYFWKEIVERNRRLTRFANESTSNLPIHLEEFFRFLQADSTRIDVYGDPHWKILAHSCWPCYLDYDYIGSFESIEREANFLIEKLFSKSSPRFKFPKSQNYRRRVFPNETLETLPISLVRQVARKYWIDFELFGYDSPYLKPDHLPNKL